MEVPSHPLGTCEMGTGGRSDVVSLIDLPTRRARGDVARVNAPRLCPATPGSAHLTPDQQFHLPVLRGLFYFSRRLGRIVDVEHNVLEVLVGGGLGHGHLTVRAVVSVIHPPEHPLESSKILAPLLPLLPAVHVGPDVDPLLIRGLLYDLSGGRGLGLGLLVPLRDRRRSLCVGHVLLGLDALALDARQRRLGHGRANRRRHRSDQSAHEVVQAELGGLAGLGSMADVEVHHHLALHHPRGTLHVIVERLLLQDLLEAAGHLRAVALVEVAEHVTLDAAARGPGRPLEGVAEHLQSAACLNLGVLTARGGRRVIVVIVLAAVVESFPVPGRVADVEDAAVRLLPLEGGRLGNGPHDVLSVVVASDGL